MNQTSIQQSLDPRLIRTDLQTQARNANNEETIQEYAEAMEKGDRFPPPIVFFDLENERYILADGFHRLFAHLRAKPNDPIIVEQYLGNLEDARWHSIGANKSHGLKRTNEDKRNAVELALFHPNGAGISDRQIADHVGVGNEMVSRIRRQLIAEERLCDSHSRIGKDGRAYDVSRIGKKPDDSMFCADCGHYKSPRCLIEGEVMEPNHPACETFIPKPPPEPEEADEEEAYDPRTEREHVPKETRHRVSRRKPGEYVEVPLCKTNTDLAAAEIRHFFDDNYLAALVQSALKLLKE